jgi:hemoglobin
MFFLNSRGVTTRRCRTGRFTAVVVSAMTLASAIPPRALAADDKPPAPSPAPPLTPLIVPSPAPGTPGGQSAAVAQPTVVRIETLYKRIGGYDTIARVTDDFLGRMAADPGLGRYFVGVSSDTRSYIRQLMVDQLCSLMGGPCLYIGRDMSVVHGGLGITGKDWETAMTLLATSLDRYKVPEKEKAEALATFDKLKGDIVEKP